MLKRAIASALFVTFSFAALAQTPEYTPITRALLSVWLNPTQFDIRDRGSRVRLAGALSDYCAEVLAVLPRNSPREEDWLQGEMNTTDSARIGRAVSSIEFGRWTLSKTFETCSVLAPEAAGGKLSKVAEALAWAELAAAFSNAEDMPKYASQAGLLVTGNDQSDIHGVLFLSGLHQALIRTVIGTLRDEP